MKKYVVTAIAILAFAVLLAGSAQAGGHASRATSGHKYLWAIQMMKALQYRFNYMIGVLPADGPGDGDGGWGPGDGTGNDHVGPGDGTGYGPGPNNCEFHKYNQRLCTQQRTRTMTRTNQ